MQLAENKSGAVIIEGHVQGLSNTRSLGEKGIPVIVIDKSNCIARYSKYCCKYFKCPDYLSAEFIDFIIDLSVKENLRNWVLIPSNDHTVKNISVNKNKLSEYYKIITDDFKIISKIYNKKTLLDLANQLNIPFPKTFYPAGIELEGFNLSFPVIVKGAEGLTFYKTLGKKVFFCSNLNELRQTLLVIKKKILLDNILIQEVIKKNESNNVCSFTAFSVSGDIKTFWVGKKIREHPSEFGTATFAGSIPVNETLDMSRKIIKELKYTGVCEIEFMKDEKDNSFKLIEINARTWLWVELAKFCGINYADYIYNYVNDIETIYPADYNTSIFWSNFWTDIIFSCIEVLKNKKSLKDISTIFKKNTIQAVYSSDDLKPFIAMTFMLPYLFLKRI
jgi:predicted ATP-grasp superfamily ATP-dependent carboligase